MWDGRVELRGVDWVGCVSTEAEQTDEQLFQEISKVGLLRGRGMCHSGWGGLNHPHAVSSSVFSQRPGFDNGKHYKAIVCLRLATVEFPHLEGDNFKLSMCISLCFTPQQANVICIVYAVNNKKSIEKVS